MTSATSAPVAAAPPTADAIPKRRFDLVPVALVVVLALLAWPVVGSSSTWFTLTVAGLAMGMIIFIAASGLTLVFGLMDVLNFGHSLFIALGAYVATSVFVGLGGWAGAPSMGFNLGAIAVAQALGDRVAVMDDGRIVHRGAMAELVADEALQQRLLGLSLAAHQ